MGKITGIIRNRELNNKPTVKFKKNQVSSIGSSERNEFSGKLLENSFRESLTKSKLRAFERTKPVETATFSAENAAGKYDPRARTSIAPDAAPAEAAQYILQYEHNFGGTAYPGEQQYFLKALADHKNDAEWTQQFFRALGSDKTSELLNTSVTTGVHLHGSAEEIETQIGAMRDAFANLASVNPPLFTQADMNLLVEKMIKAPGVFNRQIAIELFGKMGGGQENVKNMFVDAAVRLGFDKKLGADESRELLTAAAHVLTNTSLNNQAEKLNAIRTSGEGNLTRFVDLVMSGEPECPSLAGAVDIVNHHPAENVPYGQIDALLMNVAYGGYHDAHSLDANVSEADLQAVRTEMFNAVSQKLTDGSAREKYKDSQAMKNGLAQIFMRDFDRLMSPPNTGVNGAILTTDAQNGLSQFFEFSLFSTQPCSQQKQLMNFLSDEAERLSRGLTDTSPGAEDRYRQQFGRSRADAASLLGGLLGAMTIGLRDNNNLINEDAEAKTAILGFIFDLTLGNIPALGEKLSKDATDQVKKLLGTVADSVQSEVIDKIESGAIDEAKKAFVEANRSKKPEDLLIGLYEGLKITIPNGDNPGDNKFLSDFLDGYAEVITNPKNIVSGN